VTWPKPGSAVTVRDSIPHRGTQDFTNQGCEMFGSTRARLTETQRIALRCHVDGMIVVRRRDTMTKLVALNLVTVDPATMNERLKVGRLTQEGHRIAALVTDNPDRATFEINSSIAHVHPITAQL